MPIYEYACQTCKKTLEIKQKLSDDPLTICPACGGTLEKLISSPALIFKGTGWYCNEFPTKDRKKGLEADKTVATTTTSTPTCPTNGGNGACGGGPCKG